MIIARGTRLFAWDGDSPGELQLVVSIIESEEIEVAEEIVPDDAVHTPSDPGEAVEVRQDRCDRAVDIDRDLQPLEVNDEVFVFQVIHGRAV